MAVQIQGNSGVVAEVEANIRAQRVVSRAPDVASLGHYRLGMFSGIIPAALAANSEIFQFRWADATRLCLITRVRISASVTTTFFAAGVPVQIDAIKSSAWSVAGTGGTALTPAATLKKRASMGSSLLVAGDVRIATTAALGAGTKTLEANAMAALLAPGPTASPGTILPPGTELLDFDTGAGQHPLVLAQNEGFSIRSVAVPATGTWQIAVGVEWTEITAY